MRTDTEERLAKTSCVDRESLKIVRREREREIGRLVVEGRP